MYRRMTCGTVACRLQVTGRRETRSQPFLYPIPCNLQPFLRFPCSSARPSPPSLPAARRASVAAEDGQIGQVAYAASKGGVAAMTLPVARDLSKDGIRVAAILPGLFLTPMFDTLSEEARRSLAASVPFPARLGAPGEYAELAVHICENLMLNGCTLRLDGAVRLAPRCPDQIIRIMIY